MTLYRDCSWYIFTDPDSTALQHIISQVSVNCLQLFHHKHLKAHVLHATEVMCKTTHDNTTYTWICALYASCEV
jgi:hypothetical protein